MVSKSKFQHFLKHILALRERVCGGSEEDQGSLKRGME